MDFRYRSKDFKIKGVSDRDHLYRHICTYSTFYEIELLEYIAFIMKKSDIRNSIVIDVGANIGNHSIFFRTFLSEYVIAVEPNPATLPTLKSNLSRNIENYTVCEKGLGETHTKGKIVLPDGADDNIGMAELNLGAGNIDIITLDSMLVDLQAQKEIGDRVTLIKIDVEGMELSVLKGAIETIIKYRPHLLIEAATSSSLSNIKYFLEVYGYISLGHYAVTPVYHFCYKPTKFILLKASLFDIRRKIQKRLKGLLLPQ